MFLFARTTAAGGCRLWAGALRRGAFSGRPEAERPRATGRGVVSWSRVESRAAETGWATCSLPPASPAAPPRRWVRASRTSFLRFSGMNPMHREGFTRWCDESACAAKRRGQGVTLGPVYLVRGIRAGACWRYTQVRTAGCRCSGTCNHPAARAATTAPDGTIWVVDRCESARRFTAAGRAWHCASG